MLLGSEVSFEGGHKRDRFVTDLLGSFVEWVAVCPEVEVGMGTPRPALWLVREGDDVRMVEIQSGRGHTRAMQRYSAKRVRELRGLDLYGYILKKDPPSCGMARVKVYEEKGMPTQQGRGLYASVLMEAYPNLPFEDTLFCGEVTGDCVITATDALRVLRIAVGSDPAVDEADLDSL